MRGLQKHKTISITFLTKIQNNMLKMYLSLLLFSFSIVAMDRNSETAKIIERHIEITENHEDRIRDLEATTNVLQRREIARLEQDLAQQRQYLFQRLRDIQHRRQELHQQREKLAQQRNSESTRPANSSSLHASHLTDLFILGVRAAVTFTVRESLLIAYKKVMPGEPINRSYLRRMLDNMADATSWGIGYKASSSITIPNIRWAGQKTGIQKLIECTYQTNPLKNFSVSALLLTARNWLTASPITCIHSTPVNSEIIEKLKVITPSKLTPRKPIDLDLLMPLATISPRMMAFSHRPGITLPDPLHSMPPSDVLAVNHQQL